MARIGAILAGGGSRRFGSDKALAMIDGKPMIAHVAAWMAAECDAVAVCGRAWGELLTLPDQPGPGYGPLGGLLAALEHAARADAHAVLVAPCDMPHVPPGLAHRLAPGPAVADGQWLLGLWPVALGSRLRALLLAEGAISMRRWIAESGAQTVALGPIANINRPEDLRPMD